MNVEENEKREKGIWVMEGREEKELG